MTVSEPDAPMSSPSACRGSGAPAAISTRRAWNRSSSRSPRRLRVSTRQPTRGQPNGPAGARIPTSSRPSSGLASGSSTNPPGSSPTLPTTTDRARRASGSPPSRQIPNSTLGPASRLTPVAA